MRRRLDLDQAAGGKEKSSRCRLPPQTTSRQRRVHTVTRAAIALGLSWLALQRNRTVGRRHQPVDLRLGGSELEGRGVAGAEVSIASTSMTLASSSRAAVEAILNAAIYRNFLGAQPFIGVYLLDSVLARNQQGANLQIGGRLFRRTSATAFSRAWKNPQDGADHRLGQRVTRAARSSGRFALNCFLFFQKGGVGGASSRRCSARNPEEGLRPYANKEMAWAPLLKP